MIGRLLCSIGIHKWRKALIFAAGHRFEIHECERCLIDRWPR